MKTNKALMLIAAGCMLAGSTQAGVTYKDGDKYLKLGGRIQLQYNWTDPDSGSSSDDLILRRLRPYIEGSVHPDWKGKWQFDLGKGDLAVKDAYAQYKGDALGGAVVSFGNKYVQFSREALTSSKYQQLIERTFVGDHNFGSPDRQPGLHVEHGSEVFTWSASATMAAHDPDNKKLDFESAIDFDNGSDFQEGPMVAGRLELHPFGPMKYSQGDFHTEELQAALAVGVFNWNNDNDNRLDFDAEDTGKEAADDVTGFEISAAARLAGLSVDVQYNIFDSELVEGGVTGGLYENSETQLDNFSVEGGYMLLPEQVEVVGGFSMQDADNYATEWQRFEFGLNYFIKKHDVKVQATYRINQDKDGKNGNDVDEGFVQAQYVF